MRNETVFVTLSVCVTIVAASAIIAQGGPLDPPQGPISPSFKTLDQVEPRVPIDQVPFSITESGSYYLTGNLSGNAGITVSAPGVMIDLMGHTLEATGGQPTAIEADDASGGLVLRNGRLVGWGLGVAMEDGGAATIERVHFEQSSTAVLTQEKATILDCVVRGATSSGIICGDGSIVKNVIVENCTDSGIVLGNDAVVSGAEISGSGSTGLITGDRSAISDVSIVDAGFRGLDVGDGCEVIDVRARDNAHTGIRTGSECIITRCQSMNNGDQGIFAFSNCVVTECLAYGNSFGIQAVFGSVVQACVSNENLHGFLASRSTG